MLLTEIDHIAIAVKDLDAAIAYYQNAFGATVDPVSYTHLTLPTIYSV